MTTNEELPPLDETSRDLLDAERLREDVPTDAAEAIYEGVLKRGLGATAGGAMMASKNPARWLVPAWGIPAAFLVGAITTGLVMKSPAHELPVESAPTVTQANVPQMPILQPIDAPSIHAPVASAPFVVAPVAAPKSALAVAPQASPSASSSARTDTLAQERALLEIARTAFGRDDAQGTLDALDRHRNQFPDGKLAEERDALTVEALVEAGRTDEARARGRQFHLSYPNSIMRPAVDDALKSIP
jgi:hypothetical protein